MSVEALVAEGALADPLVEVLALLQAKVFLVIVEKFVLFLLCIDPEPTWTNEIGRLPALRAGSDDLVFELLGLAPLADTGQTETVATRWQDTKPGLAMRFIQYCLHANPARLFSRPRYSKA